MANPVSQCVLDWQDPVHGSFELDDVTDVSITDGRGAEIQFGVNGQPIGPKFTPGEISISLEQRVTVENGEKPNWDRLRTKQITGLLTVTEVGASGQLGQRIAYRVVVSKVDRGTNNTGDNTRTIELKDVSAPRLQ